MTEHGRPDVAPHTRRPVPGALDMLERTLPPLSPYAAAARIAHWFDRHGRILIIGVPYAWLVAFFLIPFLIVVKLAFSESTIGQPPYTPLAAVTNDGFSTVLDIRLNLSNFLALLEEDLYLVAYLNSLKIAAISTLISLAIGLPLAYAVARAPGRWKLPLMMMVIVPFWTSFLIRVYAWVGILKNEGLLNAALLATGIIQEPLIILNTNIAVYIGIVYSYLPFMVLPIYASFDRMDVSLIEAAVDLGCRSLKAFWVITVPIALPGIVAGCLLVFIPAVGEFVIPDILGGSETLMIGQQLWVQFFNNRDWPLASAVAVVLLLVLVIPITLFQRSQAIKRQADEGA